MQYTARILLFGLLAALLSPLGSARVTEAPSQITAAPTPPVPCSLASLMPECGIPCVASAAVSAVGCTNAMDFACQCSNASKMQAAVMPCVMSACGVATAPVVGSVANAICTACVGTATLATILSAA
ncbi:hypothetical protein V8F33_000680 [Rhypophila sp. PSN 637]